MSASVKAKQNTENDIPLSVEALVNLSPFRIDPDNFAVVQQLTKDGKKYNTYIHTVSPKSVPGKFFAVEMFRAESSKLRVLQYLSPDGYINATLSPAKDGGFDTVIFSLVEEAKR